MTKSKLPVVVEIQKEVTAQLASKDVMNALIATTFKGFTSELMVKQAITEGMMRGWLFENFLKKDVYALTFFNNKLQQLEYSLITSIDYSRKIGQKSGVVGKSAPTYEVSVDPETGKETIIACSITIKKKVDEYVGDFTDTVYFSEYNTNKNQWVTKPRTMIAKVAEMHALRQACPEELAKAYIEEEFQQEVEKPAVSEEDLILYTEKLESAKSLVELQKFWAEIPGQMKPKLEAKKEELKANLK